MTPRAREHDAVVLGAGAAGLASAAMLQKVGVASLVLERSAQIGTSWRSRYGLPRPPMGLVSTNRERRMGPAIDDGFVDGVKGGGSR